MMKKRKASREDISGTSGWGVWQKEPSEFPWYYSQKETCYILEGTATVTASDGETLAFGAGDLVEFERGLECRWKIDQKIVKRFQFG